MAESLLHGEQQRMRCMVDVVSDDRNRIDAMVGRSKDLPC